MTQISETATDNIHGLLLNKTVKVPYYYLCVWLEDTGLNVGRENVNEDCQDSEGIACRDWRQTMFVQAEQLGKFFASGKLKKIKCNS